MEQAMQENEAADALPIDGVRSMNDAFRVVRERMGGPDVIGSTKFDNVAEALFMRALG